MDWASSSILPFSNVRRGWSGFGSIRSIATSVVCSGSGGIGGVAGVTGAGRVGSSAPRPLPSALRELSGLFMIQNLFGQLDITFGTLRARIVGQYWFAEARRLGEPHAAGNHGLENLVLEEIFEVCRNLPGEVRTIVEHREQNAGDL